MIAFRWTLTGFLGLMWLLIATFNAWVVWREWVRKEERVESPVMVVGGLFAWLAWKACPWDSPLVGLFFWLALILDVGSLPGVVAAIIAVSLETWARSKEGEHFWKRAYMGSSWVVKFALGVFAWMVFLVVSSFLGIPIRQDEPSGLVGLLVATALYVILYAAVHVWLKKYKPQDKGG